MPRTFSPTSIEPTNVIMFAPRHAREPVAERSPTISVFQADQDGMVGIDAIVPLRVAALFMRCLQDEGIVPAIGGEPLPTA